MSVFLLQGFVESHLTTRCVSDCFGNAGAALRCVAHGGRCALPMEDDVLTFRAVLRVAVFLQVVLTYVESADRWGLGRSLHWVCLLVLDHVMFNWCM